MQARPPLAVVYARKDASKLDAYHLLQGMKVRQRPSRGFIHPALERGLSQQDWRPSFSRGGEENRVARGSKIAGRERESKQAVPWPLDYLSAIDSATRPWHTRRATMPNSVTMDGASAPERASSAEREAVKSQSRRFPAEKVSISPVVAVGSLRHVVVGRCGAWIKGAIMGTKGRLRLVEWTWRAARVGVRFDAQ